MAPSKGWPALSNTLTDCAIPPRGFDVQMLDSAGQPLEGAKFALYPFAAESKENPIEPGFTPVEGEEGRFSITDVPVGTYEFVQTKAPEGYTLLAQPARLNMYEDGQITITVTPVSSQISRVRDGRDYCTVNVKGTRALTLPMAGSPRNRLMLLGSLVAAGVAVEAARRHRAKSGAPSQRPKARHCASSPV